MHNVLKPVRQSSLEDLKKENSYDKLPEVRKAASLMPMKKPVRQQSLRDLVVSCSPPKGQSPPIAKTNVDTVALITQALKQLDNFSDLDDDMETKSQQSLPEIIL
jgi:hypothetical protein